MTTKECKYAELNRQAAAFKAAHPEIEWETHAQIKARKEEIRALRQA